MRSVNDAGEECPTTEELDTYRTEIFEGLARRDWVGTVESFGLSVGGFVLLTPDVENGNPTPRRWPIHRFARLVELIRAEYHVPIVLLGESNEAQRAAELCHLDGVLNLVGATSMEDAIDLIRGAGLMICHDGGLLFVANVLTTPTVVLLGPSDLREARPIGIRTRVVFASLPCAPCIGPAGDAAALAACPIEVSCMQQIEPGVVLDSARPYLRDVARGIISVPPARSARSSSSPYGGGVRASVSSSSSSSEDRSSRDPAV